jgi:Cyclin, N-terminal domain/Cyclin, C-terminal domain
MDNHNIADDRLNLVAFTSLMVAAKVEEKESSIPKIAELNAAIERAGSQHYLRNDFKALEKMMLRFLDFEVMVPTAATYCEYFVTVVVTNDDKRHFTQNDSLKEKFQYFRNLRECARNLFFDFLDLSLLDCNISQDVPSKVAAACIVAARRQLAIMPLWPVELCKITRYQTQLYNLFTYKIKTTNLFCLRV